MKPTLTIHTGTRTKPLEDLYGIFFEDLNHAADGGLYGELVQNRSFEFDSIDNEAYHHLCAWESIGSAELCISTTQPLHQSNPHYLIVSANAPGDGVINLGYNSGMSLVKNDSYIFSCYARGEAGVTVSVESVDGRVYATAAITAAGADWKKYQVTLVPDETDVCGRLAIRLNDVGSLQMDFISLFPPTFQGRENGMRRDIAEKLAEMTPKFMRFPGGCLVHCGSLEPDARDSMYRWKNTIGPVEERPARKNNWKYNQSLGLGYYEYFLFCEDIGAKPLPVLPAGYNPHDKLAVPIEALQPWIDDALDLIEFANGDRTTVWGAKRTALGHAAPFGLEYIAIGNEEVGQPFFDRYAYFHKAIKEKYPHIKIINSSGPNCAGGEYERGWASARENRSDYVDEHYYQAPHWFVANAHRYDDFDPNGPKVFLGEYASWGNQFYNALVEAAFMTCLEKAPAVGLACYAPMLANADYVNWQPDMIWYNNYQVYGTPNYYVQKLFMNHQGDIGLHTVIADLDAPVEAVRPAIAGDISLKADFARVAFSHIRLTNLETDEKHEFPDCQTARDFQEIQLCHIDSRRYRIELTAKVLDRSMDMRIWGNRGFAIQIGQKDSSNRLYWELGGWQNQDAMICTVVDGKNSCLTQSLFETELNQDYVVSLDIDGRRITGTVDSTVISCAEDKNPIAEALYFSSSIEEDTGDILLKVVNIREEAQRLTITLKDGNEYQCALVYEMQGYELSAENSLSQPEKVIPAEKRITVRNCCLEYTFPKHSISIFRFQNCSKVQLRIVNTESKNNIRK